MIENTCKESVTEIEVTEKQRKEFEKRINNLLSRADTVTLIGAYYLLVGFIYG